MCSRGDKIKRYTRVPLGRALACASVSVRLAARLPLSSLLLLCCPRLSASRAKTALQPSVRRASGRLRVRRN